MISKSLAPPPHADRVRGEELLDRARALVPQVRAEADEAERRGFYSSELHDAFLAAGLYRVLQPRTYGGLELDLPTFFRMIITIARADPGTAWCLSLATGHVLTAASHWPEAAQREFFGENGEFRGPHRQQPGGTARRVPGGYIVNGTWDYCSGIPYATHALFGARLIDGGPERTITVVVPRADCTVLDDWGDVMGMRASGSNGVAVNEAFVPALHAVDQSFVEMEDARMAPGVALHGNPMYLGVTGAFYHGETSSCAVGAARAALDAYEEMALTKKTSRPPIVFRYQSQDYQETFGLALGLTDAAQALIVRGAEMCMEGCTDFVEFGRPFRLEHIVRIRNLYQTAGRLAAEAVEMLFWHYGTSAGRGGNPMERYLRDVMMYKTHVISQQRPAAHLVARIRWGLVQAQAG